MKKKNMSKLCVAVFILAGLLFIYSIWTFFYCQKYISEAVKSGQLVIGGNEYDIVNFYMSSIAQYIVFGVLLIAAGSILRKLTSFVKEIPAETAAPKFKEKDNEDFDTWFEEMSGDEN